MNTTTTDYINVRAKLAQIGCRSTTGLALLPLNLESAASQADLRQQSEAATVKSLLRQAGVELTDLFNPANRPPYVQNNDISWIAPTIFVAAGVLSENSNAVAVSLSVLANSLTDFFKGRTDDPTVKLTIIVEQTRSKTCKKVSYEGPVDGLNALATVVKNIQDDNDSP